MSGKWKIRKGRVVPGWVLFDPEDRPLVIYPTQQQAIRAVRAVADLWLVNWPVK